MGDEKYRSSWSAYAIAIGWTVGGFVVLVVSRNLAGSASTEWWAGVLSNAGTAVIFVVPLYFLTKRLDHQLEAVRVEAVEGVEAVRVEGAKGVQALAARMSDFQEEFDERLEAVAHSVSERLRAEQEADAQAFDAMAAEPSGPNVIRALTIAYELELIERPPRVRASEQGGLFIAFELQGDEAPSVVHLRMILQAYNGEALDDVWWREDELASDVMVTLGRRVQAKAGPSVDLDVKALFPGLADLLRVAASSAARRPLVQLCPPQWAVTERGIVSYGSLAPSPPYEVSIDRLTDDGNWGRRMHEKSWVDMDSLEEACLAAEAVLPPRRA